MTYESALVSNYAAVRARLNPRPVPVVVRTAPVLALVPEPPRAPPKPPPTSAGGPRVPSWRILAEVCKAHGTNRDELRSPIRTRVLTAARAEAGYRLYTESGRSFKQIGEMLLRDHSTIVHSYHRFVLAHGLGEPVSWRVADLRRREAEALRLYGTGAFLCDILRATGVHSRKVRKMAGEVKA